MNQTMRWEELNNHFLTTAVAWLRLLLQRMAEPKAVDVDELEALSREIQRARTDDPPVALQLLAERFALSSFEQQILLLCAALEFDTRIAELCARAQADLGRPYPTFALGLALFDDPAWEAFSPDRPLRYWQLLEITQSGSEPLTSSALRADERIVNFLKGLNHIDDRLAPFLFNMDADMILVDLAPTHLELADGITRQIEINLSTGQPEIVQLVGPDSGSKRAIASAVAEQIGVYLYRLPAEMLPRHAPELETFARLWRRESVLMPVALYLDGMELDGPRLENGQPSDPLRRFLARLDGLVFLDSRHARPRLGRSSVIFDVDRPTTVEQRTAWDEFAPVRVAERLAAQFNLNIPAIHRIGWAVSSDNGHDGRLANESFWNACLVRTRPQLDLLAQRLEPKATWDHIVLPSEQMALLHEISDQVNERNRVYEDWGFRRKMNRGLGITALFAGESGTGKTMAAEVVANELQLDLYRIDLSAVVSKYIGETEKNLRRLFDAAEGGGAILFFDEADALFGKRSEVRDSHDRYANIEINYLLQRMEEYRGLAILATNMKSALDPAFMRRLRFIVNFPFPGQEERRTIWEGIYPAETPLTGMDYDRLAKLKLTGGSIHNIALNAAFQAARAGERVSMPILMGAARTEFRKLERPIDEREFLWSEAGER